MRVLDLFRPGKALLAVLLLLSLAGKAHAYIGPGAGLEFVSYALSMGLFVLVALSSVFMWPIYKVTRWLRNSPEKDANAQPTEASSAAEKVD